MLSPEVLPKILDSAPDAVLIVGSAGEILYASQRACTLFGYAADELSGCGIEELMPERFRQTHAHQRYRFGRERRARPMGTGLELLARRKDGAEVPVEISLSPICCEGDTFTVATVRDLTERKQVLADLLAARREADSARRSAEEARAAADRASQASQALAAASQDVRQPLQSLSLLNATLRRLIRDERASEAISGQEQAIRALSGLLTALLEATLPMTDSAVPADPKVLVIEDEGSVREATRLLLKAEGYCVSTVASLPAALNLARQESGIEVLVVKERMPDGVTGTQAIASLREVVGAQLKTLLITQHASSSLRALEHDGRVRLAMSPIDADALVANVRALRRS